MTTITEFQGEFRFLSNFWPAEVTLDGKVYPTVEHAYQAAKTLDPEERELIRTTAKPGHTKRMGRKVKQRADWEKVKVSVMRQLLQQKFNHPHLAKMLLDTGNDGLVEGNTWGDTFWGVCRGVGENTLGRLLMDIRQELRQNS